MFDICIIGGGASGMVAAITAAQEQPNARICLLEKKEILGKKLLATGNGRCNLSNVRCAKVKETLAFFAQLGLLTRQEEGGGIYPYAEQAKGVVWSLTNALKTLGVMIMTNHPVSTIRKTDDGFCVEGDGQSIQARSLLLATGGKAAPQYGTTGDGYGLAKTLGHTVTRLAPILSPLETVRDMKKLKGLRFQACLTLWRQKEKIAEESGQVQLTADGISGICVFNLSRFIKLGERVSFQDYRITVDFLPHMAAPEIRQLLQERATLSTAVPDQLLLSILPHPLDQVLLEEAKATAPQGTDIPTLVTLLKQWSLQLSGVKGWKQAQCTSGGIPLTEIDQSTMESRKTPNLYFAGELLDYDGPCGGYNLQNAWETGIRAGKAMAQHV